MTVATETAYAERAWTGVETSFTPGFSAQAAAHVVVSFRAVSGTVTPLALGPHYTVKLGAGGAVTVLAVALPPAPGTLRIGRATPATQTIDFSDLQDFPFATFSDLFDAAALRDAEIRHDIAANVGPFAVDAIGGGVDFRPLRVTAADPLHDGDLATQGYVLAVTHVTDITTYVAAAGASATAAAGSATQAGSARDTAQQWAAASHGVVITGGLNSAFSYAQDAQASAAAAASGAAALVNTDYGFVTDAPTTARDYGTVGVNLGNFMSYTPNPVAGPNYTFIAGDNSAFVERSNNGAAMTDTLPGTDLGVLPAKTLWTVKNTDSAALWAPQLGPGVTLDGQPVVKLWLGPNQEASFYSDGTNYFTFDKPALCRLGAPTTLYFNPAGGVDTNSGIDAAHAFASAQHAFDTALAYFHMAGNTITFLQTAPGTSTLGINIAGQRISGQGDQSTVQFIGDLVNSPPLCVIDTSASGNCVFGSGGANFTVRGFQFIAKAGFACIASIDKATNIAQWTNDFGAAAGGYHMYLSLGNMSVKGNYTVSGDADTHLRNANGFFDMEAPSAGPRWVVTAVGARTFANFVNTDFLGMTDWKRTDFPGTWHGRRFLGDALSVYHTQASLTFPGDVAGIAPNYD